MVDGKVATESREVSGFERIKLKDYGQVFLSQGPVESLTIEADPELLPKIRSKVVNKTLIIEIKQDWLNKLFSAAQSIGKSPITVTIVMKKIHELEIFGKYEIFADAIDTETLTVHASGMSKIEIPSLQAENLNMKISGRSEFAGAGHVTEFRIGISGSGDCLAEKLECQRATVKISGHGNAKIWVNEKLDVRISGFGNVSYKGAPKISQTISGAGSVSPLE